MAPTAMETRFQRPFHGWTLKRVLVCSPRTAGWNQPERAARWRELGFCRSPDFETAQAQHQSFVSRTGIVGREVEDIACRRSDLSLDAVYTHDPSLPTDFGLILMHPGKANRVPEGATSRDLLPDSLAFPMLAKIHGPGNPEAGDMVWLDSKTLLIGHGYRTNARASSKCGHCFNPTAWKCFPRHCRTAPDPSACLHLMSLMSLLDEQTVLVDLPWLAVETVELLQARGYRLIEIDYSERDTLACNVLSLGENRLLALEENAKTKRLRQAGFDVRTFPGSELCVNGGGGPTCLTRPLLRG